MRLTVILALMGCATDSASTDDVTALAARVQALEDAQPADAGPTAADLAAVATDVTDVATRVDGLETDQASAADAITGIGHRLDQLEANQTALEDRLDNGAVENWALTAVLGTTVTYSYTSASSAVAGATITAGFKVADIRCASTV